MRTDTKSRKSPNNMFHESQREAMGKDNFTSKLKRKHFICTDRRDFTNYQNTVEELEQKKRQSIKRYEEEIIDCKTIYRQFELQKQGVIPCGSLITGNQNSIKSSVTFRQQNLLKSVRRSLAPRTTLESSKRPVLNYELISKQPSVPHRIKIEIVKREQRRLKEAEEVVNHVEFKEPESTNIYLDDAVAMYARLRKEVDKGMEKRSHISFSSQPMTVNKDHRPLSVPKARPTTIATLPSAGTAPQVRLPLVYDKIDSSSKYKGVKTALMALPKQIKEENEISHDKEIQSKANGQILDKESKLENSKYEKDFQDDNVLASENSAAHLELNEGELVESDNNMPHLMNNFCTSPKRLMQSVAFTLPEYHANMDNKGSYQNDSNLDQNDELSPTRLNSRRHTFVASEQKVSQYNLGERSSSLPLLNKQRRHSATALSTDITAENGRGNERTVTTTHRVGKRFERRSNSIAGLSTDKLQAIITEKIIGQLTNVQRRSSISSNQQTSLLKNYARMLQTELKLDDIPESESPDFSETPFMRSITKVSKPESDSDKAETEKLTGSQLWESHLKFGSFRSTLTYSEIEEDDNIDPKVRRRQRLTTVEAAGIVTQKEKAPKLAKLRKRQTGESVCEDNDYNINGSEDGRSEQDSTNF